MKTPSVGIFWAVPDDRGQLTLVLDRTSVAEAEPYGDCLTHSRGYYEVLVGQPERIHPRLHSGAVKDTSPACDTRVRTLVLLPSSVSYADVYLRRSDGLSTGAR